MHDQISIAEEKIVSNEELFRIEGSELHLMLHRSIGAITYLNKNKKLSTGSGVLISKNLVLTAAHNVFDKIFCCEHVGFKFYLGANGVAKDYYEIQDWKYAPQYQTSSKKEKLKYDYALLKLKKSVQYTQFLKLSLPCQLCLIKQNQQNYVEIFGFPGCSYENFKPKDKFGKQFILYQYGLARSNRITTIEANDFKIGYGISTLGGQSGCPVVIGDDIIAVHNGGGRDGQQFNVGRLLTIDALQNLKKWCKQLNGQQFDIQDKIICPHNKSIISHLLNSLSLQKLTQQVKSLQKIKAQLQTKVKQLDSCLFIQRQESQKLRLSNARLAEELANEKGQRKKYQQLFYEAQRSIQIMKKQFNQSISASQDKNQLKPAEKGAKEWKQLKSQDQEKKEGQENIQNQ